MTNAIDGVTINLLKQSPLGVPQALSVGVDQSAVTTALNAFITSFNSLADTLDKATAMTPGPPALVRIPSRSPRGTFFLPSSSATSKISPKSKTRATPARRKAAS